jgi:hypothetical protein
MIILIILAVVFVLILSHQLDESYYREKYIENKTKFEEEKKIKNDSK